MTAILAVELRGREADVFRQISLLGREIRVTAAEGILAAAEAETLGLLAARVDAASEPAVFGAIEALRACGRCPPVVLFARESTEDMAVRAIRAGVSDYVRLPAPATEIIAALNRCLPARERESAAILSGESPAIVKARAQILRVAPTESTVLITGETGTGKELAADLIHRNSARRQGPFVCVNCAAIPESLLESELFGHERGAFTGADARQSGLLEHAAGGTVFLDEVGDMNAAVQAKILRALESRRVQPLGGRRDIRLDIRLVAATNRDLEQMVRDRKFRQDLYFRLAVARIHMPSLRDHREDIPLLFYRYAGEFGATNRLRVPRLGSGVMDRLREYDWPGNVRELRNFSEACLTLSDSDVLAVEDLPAEFLAPSALNEDERERLLFALTSAEWNRSEAARQLHWSRMTLYRKMKKYSLLHPRAASAEPPA